MPEAIVDLDALARNLLRIRARLTDMTGILAAVKADGYGHGALEVARRLEREGVGWFGVATAEEALALRGGGIAGNVLMFGPVPPFRGQDRLAELAEAGIQVTVTDETSILRLEAALLPRRLKVHLKVDTGMGRLGVPWQNTLPLAERLDRSEVLDFAGVWTHFARSDEPGSDFTRRQLEAFLETLVRLDKARLRPPLTHAANSAAIFAFPDAAFDLVRPGIALYGYHSSPAIAALEPGLEPVMTLTAPVVFVKEIAAGTPISYGSLWLAKQPTRIATVRIGYADGYPRQLSSRGWVMVRGERAEIAGRVCMDQLMVDVGGLALEPGDRVTLFGRGGPDAEALAAAAGTISYELLTRVGPRVGRRYLPERP